MLCDLSDPEIQLSETEGTSTRAVLWEMVGLNEGNRLRVIPGQCCCPSLGLSSGQVELRTMAMSRNEGNQIKDDLYHILHRTERKDVQVLVCDRLFEMSSNRSWCYSRCLSGQPVPAGDQNLFHG